MLPPAGASVSLVLVDKKTLQKASFFCVKMQLRSCRYKWAKWVSYKIY